MTRTTDRDWNDDFNSADWTPADDELIRSALMTLRDDVDALPLPEPAFIRARYGARKQRRALAWVAGVAAAAIVIAAVAFSQLGQPTAAPLTPATQSTAATETASVEPTQDPSDDPASGEPTPDAATGAPTEGASGVVPAQPIEPCGAVDIGPVNLDVVYVDAGATALRLMDDARSCSQQALIHAATVDQTELSFGAITPEQAFAIPNAVEGENRYELLSRVLTLPAEETTVDGNTIYRWPAEPRTEADWQRIIDAGVITAEDRAMMEQGGSGYIGYRVVIHQGGQWLAFIGGD